MCERIILSRKGFDSGYGGCASPIFPDNTMLSLPIPTKDEYIKDSGTECFENLFFEYESNSYSYYDIWKSLNCKKMKKQFEIGRRYVHLDPDIDSRNPKSLKAFGQAGTAQSYLKNQKVTEGDLFLFFGWFRHVIVVDNHIKYNTTDKNYNMHTLWGYLKIDKVIESPTESNLVELSQGHLLKHPHLSDSLQKASNNAIYVGDQCGVFNFSDKLVLTKNVKENPARSKWALPEDFKRCEWGRKVNKEAPVVNDKFEVYLRGQWQECVLSKCNAHPEDWKRICNWATEIIQKNKVGKT